MKLLDILAKELVDWPKFDGNDAFCVAQDFDFSVNAYGDDVSKCMDSNGKVIFKSKSNYKHLLFSELALDQKNAIITKEMWESARATHISDQPETNHWLTKLYGNNIPPIDTECKFTYRSGPKLGCTIKDIGQKGVYLYIPSRDSNAYDYDCYKWYPKDQVEFFVESDRDRAINNMVIAASSGLIVNGEVKAYFKHMAEVLYDDGWRKTKSNED